MWKKEMKRDSQTTDKEKKLTKIPTEAGQKNL